MEIKNKRKNPKRPNTEGSIDNRSGSTFILKNVQYDLDIIKVNMKGVVYLILTNFLMTLNKKSYLQTVVT